MKELSQRARSLTPEQLSELAMRRRQGRGAGSAPAGEPEIGRRGASSGPLSFAQQRLWLLDQLEPGSPAYNLAAPVRLRGPLAPGVLAGCLDEIARRHESMRTRFEVRSGDPVQVIAPPAPFPLPLIDLSELPAGGRESEAWRLARADAAAPFDLARGPLARAHLLRLDLEEHLLLFTVHHVVSDGWSFGVLYRELSVLYGAVAAGRPSPLAELPIQYLDFARWQREWLQGPPLQEQLAYWRTQLAGAPAALELPTDRLRPPVQSHRGEHLTLRIPVDLTASLHQIARSRRATLFMVLLAACKVLLQRWAGQDDVVVGSPSAGRRRVETEGLIGFFLNTLVLRTDLGGNPSFQELVARIREVVLGAYAHQDVPFERLLDELQVERQLSRSPLFQVLFNMINLPPAQLDLSGLVVEPLGAPETPAKFDFTLYLAEQDGEIACDLMYDADLFERARMEALLAEYLHLLAQAAAAPDTPIAALSLLPPAHSSRLPDPCRDLPSTPWPGPVHERLTLHAAHAPEREAVADAEESWTYGELEARANQLAHALCRAGVGREDVVAIYAHRNASLAWAVLGTLKAGAAFLILDPVYPAARLRDYLEIARPAAWLAVRGAGEVPVELEAALAPLPLRLELPPRSRAAAEGTLAGLPTSPPEVAVAPEDLACIGFTSGSTGRPKGVAGLHGSLSQFQPWWAERFALGERDRFAMLSALSHDPLQRDLLTPLWLGACLRIPEPERLGEPGWVAAWAAREEVTVVHLTPALMELLISGEPAPRLPCLRRAFVVGDLLRRSEVERLQRAAPVVDCVNLYGSTETQRAVSYSPIGRGAGPRAKETLPLGRGISGVELLVLNAGCALAGIGEVGEIHLRSRRLARGYLEDGELTAQRFLANPFRPAAVDPGDRLYRTGDLGRYLPDGEVEFVGRADQQLKIRGFRIEPGEIEAALRAHPAVRGCVVIARGEGERRRLVAYLAPAAAASAPSELRAFLAARLPDYMVPAVFVGLAALPQTHTGKVDRRALPEPEAAAAAAAAPRTAVEELIAGIWEELLGLTAGTVGSHANFFDLGGHSLLATRVLSRVREALGAAVALRELFAAPTVAGLAAEIERRRGEAPPAAPPLVPRGRRGEATALPLSFAQQRMWILDQLEPGSFAYNVSTALRLDGPLDTSALAAALSEIVRRHEALRTVFAAGAAGAAGADGDEGEARQVILPPAGQPLPQVDLAALPEPARATESRWLAAGDGLRPFDLARGPLLRTTLLRLAKREHVLLLAFHHIVTDGWSLGIFTRELTTLYGAFAAGAPSPLDELPVQYADFALWQRGWLQGEVLAEQLGYWRRHLEGAPPVLELPADRPRPPVQSHRGGRRWRTLPRELTTGLMAVSRRLEVTPFMALLAAFAALLWRTSGEDDLVIGTPIANRSRPELEELIGFFANTLALRVNAGGDPSFAGLAHRVRETALGAYAHQDLPFERLVDELQPERDLGHAPVFQVMLVLQNAPPAVLELGDLKVGVLEDEAGRAPFDLSLTLIEVDGELAVRLEHSADLFDAASAARLLGHFAALLAGALAAPQSRLSAVTLLSEAERRELLVGWNDSRAEFPAERTLPELLAAAAQRAPQAVAVSCRGRVLRYGELDERAERLACRLKAYGVGPEVRVGLCLERSPEMLVALLAVLKAGGAYVPLDPHHPRERLGWILEDAQTPVLIADRASLAALPEHCAVVIDPAGEVGDLGGAALSAALPENLAYVIYTSGSTGRPKGVEVRHRGVVNYLWSMARRPGMAAGDTVLALTTLSFDIHVTELLLPLAVGARIELVDRETATDPERLGAAIAQAGVTVMQATPATWTLLLEGGWQGAPALKALAGGEALPPALAGKLRESVGSLWNVYGPTETTVWSTLHPVTEPVGGRISIGRPLANTTVHLLDAGGEPAPVGVGGELCIGGEGLARGYHRRPDLTAERFVPDPFGPPGSRLYRTGDLARRRTGGDLECLGRIDQQVKVRGFRIELGEIEAALLRLAAVTQAAVVVREEGGGDRRLVAFLATEPGAAPSAGELRDALLRGLPDYMVPAGFVLVDALPLTPTGKVDRRALARRDLAPELAGLDGRERAAPRDETERTLVALWAEILGRPEIGIHDRFFELGGDSILAIRLVARARKAGLRFSPRQLFQHQTIAALAPQVEREAPVTELSEAETRMLLEEIAARQGLSPVELIAAALARAVSVWSGRPEADVAVEVRGPCDFSQPLPSRPVFALGRTLEAVAGIVEGRLRIDWLYDQGTHRPEAVSALVEAAITALQELTDQRPAAGTGKLTPSEFPAAGLTQEQLDDLLAELAID